MHERLPVFVQRPMLTGPALYRISLALRLRNEDCLRLVLPWLSVSSGASRLRGRRHFAQYTLRSEACAYSVHFANQEVIRIHRALCSISWHAYSSLGSVLYSPGLSPISPAS